MTKREKVFAKTNGKCSYCGCDLQKGWHMDHMNPVERKFERKGGGLFLRGTEIPLDDKHFEEGKMPDYEHRESKFVQVGFHKPENDTIENLWPACRSCNINKHSMNAEQFRAFIARFVESLNKRNVQYIVAKRYGLIKETGAEVKFYYETLPQVQTNF